MHSSFPLIADILTRELTPQGFNVSVNAITNKVICTDVVGNHINGIPSGTATFVVTVGNADA